MKRVFFILPILIGCSVQDDEFQDTDSESSGVARDAELVADDDPQAAGPVFEDGEHVDMCCPLLADGRLLDSLCRNDDPGDDCSLYSTGWSAAGSTVSDYRIISCYTCGTNSPNCSGTRWYKPNTMLDFWTCGGTAVRKYNNALIDDDCAGQACSGAETVLSTSDPCPGTNICIQSNDTCTVPVLDSSLAALCCNSSDICTGAHLGNNDGETPNCGSAGLQNAGFTTLAWCHPCEGVASTDQTHGAWDLTYDGVNQAQEWFNSMTCTEILDGSFGVGVDYFAGEYSCGGYLYSSNGTLLNNNCD